MPFDRLISRVDQWAGTRGRLDVFAQIGSSSLQTEHVKTTRFLSPNEFRSRISSSSAIVGHAGMGTIIQALQLSKPLLVFPRRGALNETRNDHQVGTARHFAESGRILAAFTDDELTALLDEIEAFAPGHGIAATASPQLVETIRRFTFKS